jgi:hypothetical protein
MTLHINRGGAGVNGPPHGQTKGSLMATTKYDCISTLIWLTLALIAVVIAIT